MIKVLIVDDLDILRMGIEIVLKQDPEIQVIGMVGNGKQAVEFCKKQRPDVIIMDMWMPDYDGAYATTHIKEMDQGIKILVLTTFDDEETVNRALKSGVDGYILKEMEDYQIINAVKSTYAGINVLGMGIFEMLKEADKNTTPSESVRGLSDRERELLAYIMKGYSNKEIASELNFAEGTVRNNISRLLEKLGLKDRTQLAVFAVKNGIE